MNPELKDPVNITGIALTIIGSILFFCPLILDGIPDAFIFTGIFIYVAGVIVLAIHSRKRG